MPRFAKLGLLVRDEKWLADPATPAGPATPAAMAQPDEPATAVRSHAPQVLPRGEVADLPAPASGVPMPQWYVTANWAPEEHCEVDVVAFVLDEDEQVVFDEDFVFYGAPENPSGTVCLLTGGPGEQTIAIDLASLPPSTHKIVVAATIDGTAAFGDIGAVQVATAPGSSAAALTQAPLDAATSERTLLLAELYRRGPAWRFRAVGQGYDHGLADLARGYGVAITD
ncbi:TerD family protein [Streptomyces sp. NPDC054796]